MSRDTVLLDKVLYAAALLTVLAVGFALGSIAMHDHGPQNCAASEAARRV
jgi:hypothetical protein